MQYFNLWVDDANRLQATSFGSSWFTDDEPVLLICFYLAPGLDVASAESAMEELLRRYGVSWLEKLDGQWLLDGTTLRAWDRERENWLPRWIVGRYPVKPTLKPSNNPSRRGQEATEFRLKITESFATSNTATSLPTRGAPMTITLTRNQEFRSIKASEQPVSVPQFTVLTGLNGSGKSHVLAAIAEGAMQLLRDGQELNPKRLIDHGALTPASVEVANPLNDVQTKGAWIATLKNWLILANQHPDYPIGSLERRFQSLLEGIAQRAGKKPHKLTGDELVANWPVTTEDATNVLANTVASTFRQYADHRIRNAAVEAAVKRKWGKGAFYTESEFLKKYGPPPWELINRFLEEAGLTIRLSEPPFQTEPLPFELTVTDTGTARPLNFKDLSSGEKIFISLGAALYNVQTNALFPRVLLLDEPDSHLHPRLAKKLLDAITRVFVAERGLVVIMATHSPTTVALAPEESIYAVTKEEPRIGKISKDRALALLTTGLPALSINHVNRRQVFVESKYDEYFYDQLWIRLRPELDSEVSLNFISSAIGGSGSSNAVKEVVKKLRDRGNKTVYGIIDWDLTNKEDGAVKVLGHETRYSIENYIFDPLPLAVLVLRERVVGDVDLGFDDATTHTDFRDYDVVRLQSIVNGVVARIAEKLKPDQTADTTPVQCEYINKNVVTIPKWYLVLRGHNLEDAVKAAFPGLQDFHNEGELKTAVIDRALRDVPGLIPADFLGLFQRLQAID